MAKDPAFLFYSSDFLTGISDLTMEERGQYITLLCLQHQKGALSKKIMSIQCHGKVSEDVLQKFEKNEQGLFFNKRLEIERGKRSEHSRKQSLRAKEGWKKRKANEKVNQSHGNATAMPLENENEIENRNVNRGSTKNEVVKKAKTEISEIVEKMPEYIQEFVAHRKTIKKPFKTVDQLKKWCEKLKRMSNGSNELAKQIVDNSIAEGYQGIFPPSKDQIKTSDRITVDEAVENIKLGNATPEKKYVWRNPPQLESNTENQ